MERGDVKKDTCTAIILAAGQGKRMNSKIPKLYLELQGKPILYYTLQTFTDSQYIDRVILVVGEGQIEQVQNDIVAHYNFSKVTDVIEGGKERYDSVWCALQCISDKQDSYVLRKDARENANAKGLADRQSSYVFIHDGARAFVSEEIIKRAYENVLKYKACVVGMPVKDTIKIVDNNQLVNETPDRKFLWQAQTPQVFEAGLIIEAYENVMNHRSDFSADMITDDSMLVEQLGKCKVQLVQGSYDNIKITTPEDIAVAKQICETKRSRRPDDRVEV
jgi:4-diphosphocytidyl-2-methyl-D-erithritol synthase